MNTKERIEHHDKIIDVLVEIESHEDIIAIEKEAISKFGHYYPELKVKHQKNIDRLNGKIKQLEQNYNELKAKL
jgi:polyhydroxyalkanoate synthesis regulator phasin